MAQITYHSIGHCLFFYKVYAMNLFDSRVDWSGMLAHHRTFRISHIAKACLAIGIKFHPFKLFTWDGARDGIMGNLSSTTAPTALAFLWSVECGLSSVECGLWSLAIHLAPSFQTTTTIAPGLLAFAINESVSFVLGFSPPVTWLESLFQVSTVNTSI